MSTEIRSVIWAHDELTVRTETSGRELNALVDEKVEQHVALLRHEGWVLRNGVTLSRENAGDGLSLINMNMLFERTLGEQPTAPDTRSRRSKTGSDSD